MFIIDTFIFIYAKWKKSKCYVEKKFSNKNYKQICVTLFIIFSIHMCFEIIIFLISILIGIFNFLSIFYIRLFKFNLGNYGEKILLKSLKRLNSKKYKVKIKMKFFLQNYSTCFPDVTVYNKKLKINIPIDAKNSVQIIKLRTILKYFKFNLSFFIINKFIFKFYEKKKMKSFLMRNYHVMKKRKYEQITRNPIKYIFFIPSDFYREKLKKNFTKEIKKMQRERIYICSHNNIKETIENIEYDVETVFKSNPHLIFK